MQDQKDYHSMSESEKKKEDWMNSKWRPMMGWLYMVVCMCDFVLFPVLWGIFHAVMHSTQVSQWQPLTLQGAGLFHLAMGAVLGLAAWGRTQEKLGGANNGGLSMPGMGSSFGGPSPMGGSSFGAPSTGGFGGSTGSFGSPAAPRASFGGAPSTGGFGGPKPGVGMSSCGRAMPAQQEDEAL